eukprot:CAMPEP_0172534148 /NCGR_PEP_ID=MMETSP1067-20121228/6616_1 /TAXON_ID=265564 ORGANISM="Thalassiosira punctigera, Strain Tpunct2005C2" /NCGR_SAMPLE_ID=MMETSP1067 /ASSEMBLY_ACC=CAM_ASM_000444 /LENGTH=204 /DNA_ID=CAMNT_0013318899 /DNA_START=64 /DNA_END=675 /DNA_ORIENTATION=-
MEHQQQKMDGAGRCALHPDVQLRFRRTKGGERRILLRACPLCAAAFEFPATAMRRRSISAATKNEHEEERQKNKGTKPLCEDYDGDYADDDEAGGEEDGERQPTSRSSLVDGIGNMGAWNRKQKNTSRRSSAVSNKNKSPQLLRLTVNNKFDEFLKKDTAHHHHQQVPRVVVGQQQENHRGKVKDRGISAIAADQSGLNIDTAV